jgi:hypothetical protein
VAQSKQQNLTTRSAGLAEENDMAKTTENEAVKTEVPAMSQEQLMALLAKLVENQSIKDDKFVDALTKLREPYKDPLQEENQRRAREVEKEQQARQKKQKSRDQELCPHVKGILGDKPSLNESSFIIHREDTGLTVGICTACQKIINHLNPDDAKWFRQARSGNRMSGAGVRTIVDQNKAMKDGFLTDVE